LKLLLLEARANEGVSMTKIEDAKQYTMAVIKIIDEKVSPRDRESRKLLLACAEALDRVTTLLEEEITDRGEVTNDPENKQGE